ncbi:hypothetical protein [Halobacteriovorax marinus]|uniref:hypothetical protein n=1 Tax=Halobacteriovorax marinus TaxID=97084 RepID=UPI003A8F5B94
MTPRKLIQFSLICFFSLGSISCSKSEKPIIKDLQVSAAKSESLTKNTVQPESRRPQSESSSGQVLHGLGLEDYEKVAKQIFLVKEAMSEEYPVGDGLTFTMYILRYLSEVGDYILTNEDISNLLVAFEKISGEKLDETIYETVAQIKKLKFGKNSGKYAVEIFAFNKKEGVLIPINEVSEEGMVQEIKYARIKDKAEIIFDDVDSKLEIKALKRFLTEKITIPLVSDSMLPPLNQLHKDIKYDVENYIDNTKIIPLEIKTEGIYIKVDTSTVFNNMKFYLRTLYTLPGRKKDGAAIPSLVMRIRAKLVNVKISIDQ